MSKLFSLGPRLKKCADFVRPNVRVADIGTDHGYLPIWLLKSGKAVSAVAADIGAGPLESAKNNAVKYHADLETVLSDGFDKVLSFDDAVIAGMGGELIVKIMDKAAILKDPQKRLILQPMTSAYELRKYLWESGFIIECEEAVKDDGKIYSVMRVAYTGEKKACNAMSLYMGELSPAMEYSREYAEHVIKRLNNIKLGYLHTGNAEKAEAVEAAIEGINEIYMRVEG